MVRARITAVLLVCGAALLIAGCVQGLPGTDETREEDRSPGLIDFRSNGSQCTDDFAQNSSTSIESGDPITRVTIERNVSVPDGSYEVGEVQFETVNDSTSRLDVPTRATETPADACDGTTYIRYNATVDVTTDDGAWRLVVTHDDERSTVLYGDSNRSGASASASAGERVTEPDTGTSGGTDGGSDGETARDTDGDATERPSQIAFDDLPGDAQQEFRTALANGSVETDEPPALYGALDLGDDRAHVRYEGRVYEPVVANLTGSEDAAYDYRVTLRNRSR